MQGTRWHPCIESECSWLYPSSHAFRLNVCTSWWPEHLFLACCSSWLPLNWISSSRSQACHRSQGLLNITTGPTLSGRFRAKLITCLPLWLITGMFSGATYHLGSLGRVLFVCTSGIGFVSLIPRVTRVDRQDSQSVAWLCYTLPMPALTGVKRTVHQTQRLLCPSYVNSMIHTIVFPLLHSLWKTNKKEVLFRAVYGNSGDSGDEIVT